MTYNIFAVDIADLPASLVRGARVGSGLAALGGGIKGSGSSQGDESSEGNGELHVCGWWFLVRRKM
jgi:hypothetical protein